MHIANPRRVAMEATLLIGILSMIFAFSLVQPNSSYTAAQDAPLINKNPFADVRPSLNTDTSNTDTGNNSPWRRQAAANDEGVIKPGISNGLQDDDQLSDDLKPPAPAAPAKTEAPESKTPEQCCSEDLLSAPVTSTTAVGVLKDPQLTFDFARLDEELSEIRDTVNSQSETINQQTEIINQLSKANAKFADVLTQQEIVDLIKSMQTTTVATVKSDSGNTVAPISSAIEDDVSVDGYQGTFKVTRGGMVTSVQDIGSGSLQSYQVVPGNEFSVRLPVASTAINNRNAPTQLVPQVSDANRWASSITTQPTYAEQDFYSATAGPNTLISPVTPSTEFTDSSQCYIDPVTNQKVCPQPVSMFNTNQMKTYSSQPRQRSGILNRGLFNRRSR